MLPEQKTKVKKIGAKTETEAIDKALNFLIEKDTFMLYLHKK